MQLTNDAYALIMTCSYVGLNPKGEVRPFSLKEWNALAQKIHHSQLKTPGRMLGLSAETLQIELDLSLSEAQRLAILLDRGGTVGFELESMMNAGIRVLTRSDPDYPQRLKKKLKSQAPVVLFLAGALELSQKEGVAIVGSRAVDEAGKCFTAKLAELCARSHMNVVSGGAKGVDEISMNSALENGGTCIGVLGDSLVKRIRERQARQYIFEERLLLLSPFHPNAPFQIANAMARNKLIYVLANYAVVVASDFEKGGTWAGATENLRKGYTPLFVRSDIDVPKGNLALLEKNTATLTSAEIEIIDLDLKELFAQKKPQQKEIEKSYSRQMNLL